MGQEAVVRSPCSLIDLTLLVNIPALEALLPRHDRVASLLGLGFFSGRLALEEIDVLLLFDSRENTIFSIGTRSYGL